MPTLKKIKSIKDDFSGDTISNAVKEVLVHKLKNQRSYAKVQLMSHDNILIHFKN